MLYIVRVYEDGKKYEYEYGNIRHALEHYIHEQTAKLVEYNNGEELIIKEKFNGVEVNNWQYKINLVKYRKESDQYGQKEKQKRI